MTPVSERKSETHELLPTAAAEAVTLPDWGPPFRLPSHHHQCPDRGVSADALGELYDRRAFSFASRAVARRLSPAKPLEGRRCEAARCAAVQGGRLCLHFVSLLGVGAPWLLRAGISRQCEHRGHDRSYNGQ